MQMFGSHCDNFSLSFPAFLVTGYEAQSESTYNVEEDLSAQDLVDFSPVYRCLHIHTVLVSSTRNFLVFNVVLCHLWLRMPKNCTKVITGSSVRSRPG